MGMSSMVSPSVVSLEEAESQHLPGAGSVLSLEASFGSRLVEVSLFLREGLRLEGARKGITRGGVGWGLGEGVQMGAQ